MSLPTLYEYYTSPAVTAGLNADQPYFTLNEKNITIYSGALHYFRVPQEYWRDRLRKLRAAGLNTVETYVPWNLHEPEPGNYDFGNGGSDFQQLLDVEKFLKMAQEEDLFAIVRPGPFICSEWEFGGLPSWLLREKGIQLRTSDEVFIGYVERYFKALLTILTTLQFTIGGPIIAFQIENEYASLQRYDLPYLEGLKDMMSKLGVVELFVTSDGPKNGDRGQIPGVLYTANFDKDPEKMLDLVQEMQPGRPSMVMEYWSGWFDHWTEQHHTVTNKYFSDMVERILQYPSSINFYMFHGGTSFGFMNGANYDDHNSWDNSVYQPDISSYDYNAPLNENGDYTDKYFSLKEIISKHNKVELIHPLLPDETPTKAYAPISVVSRIPYEEVINQAPHKIESTTLLPMEMLPINNNAGQSYGYIVYRKNNIDISTESILTIYGHVCDTAMVLINGKLVSKVTKNRLDLNGFGYWKAENATLTIQNAYEDATLDIIVENWGRVNFADRLEQLQQFKGLVHGNVAINEEVINGWEIIPLEFKSNWNKNLDNWEPAKFETGPALYQAYLFIGDEPQDTYIDMRKWNKGIVIVNGFVLSRYFHLGPQQTAYLPAPLLITGFNEIVFFEHFNAPAVVEFSEKQIFETLL